MRIAVIGLGLIGGSVALAARERLGAEIFGADRDPGVREAALAGGVVDRVCATGAETLADADAAFVAVPVGAVRQEVGEVLEAAPANCVVTDVGSTKRRIVAAHSDPRFVGGHPLAGSEHSGLRHARADMFAGATWYLVPGATTRRETYERLRGLLEALGARPRKIDAQVHDTLMATVSHLPHVIASVLVSQACSTLPGDELAAACTGPSFRGATRVAGAPSEIWTEIYVTNADLLAVAVGETIGRLAEFEQVLRAADRAGIEAFIASSCAARERLEEAALGRERLGEAGLVRKRLEEAGPACGRPREEPR
jgi:prephenate dehydrogenase